MRTNSRDSGEEFARAEFAQREIWTCPICGTKFTATSASALCPVCMLRGAASGGSTSAEVPASASGHSSAETEPLSIGRRVENYRLMLDEDGKPIELGRGAMGITYKAFDVDLRCPVTLKVISERYVGDDSARLRFLREARAAANIAASQCRFSLTPWKKRSGLLLRHGVCGRGDPAEAYQALRLD